MEKILSEHRKLVGDFEFLQIADESEIAALRAAPLASLSQAFCTLGLDWDAPTW